MKQIPEKGTIIYHKRTHRIYEYLGEEGAGITVHRLRNVDTDEEWPVSVDALMRNYELAPDAAKPRFTDYEGEPENMTPEMMEAIRLKDALTNYCKAHSISVLVSLQDNQDPRGLLTNTFTGFLDLMTIPLMLEHITHSTAKFMISAIRNMQSEGNGPDPEEQMLARLDKIGEGE